jgi:putative ABC transport system permease protein
MRAVTAKIVAEVFGPGNDDSLFMSPAPLAALGLVIAVAGALAPATWAARSRTAAALRTE